MDHRWSLFLVSFGFLVIATTPITGNSIMTIVIGALIVVLGFIQIRRNKKK